MTPRHLRVTDNASLIVTGSTYMGMLTDLLRWNIDDPPSDFERNRHEVVYSYQHNRNPFIDRSEWAGCLFRGACPNTPLALSPASLSGSTDDVTVTLDWADNGETIFAGYRIYRSTAAAGPFTRLTTLLHLTSNYHDAAVTPGTRYYYRVVTVDAAGRESNPSSADVWPGQPVVTSSLIFINEIHYDNAGTDSGERVEILAPAGTNMSGWKLIAYNGTGGAQYATVNLSGTIPNQASCRGTLSFHRAGNWCPGGWATPKYCELSGWLQRCHSTKMIRSVRPTAESALWS